MNIRNTLFISILLMTLLACVVPGVPSTSTSGPAAENRLQVMVAETVAAAITQTAQAIPPTFTPTSTATSTPEPTGTPTALPVGSTLTRQENKSTLFTDERAGYTVNLPDGWLTVRVNEPEFLEALTLAEAADPLVMEVLTGIKNENPGILRLFAVDVQDETIQNEPVTTIKFIWDEKKAVSFNSDEDLRAFADELVKTVEGLEVTSMNIMITPAAMQFGVIESKTTGSNGMLVIQKRVSFKAKTGSMTVILTTGESLKRDIIPAFDVIMDTIKLLP